MFSQNCDSGHSFQSLLEVNRGDYEVAQVRKTDSVLSQLSSSSYGKDLVHEGLECRRSAAEAKGHPSEVVGGIAEYNERGF